MKKIVLLFLLLSFVSVDAQKKALLKSANSNEIYGFGSGTTGGEGGTVYTVTSLSSGAGAGTFKAALNASGARIVKFAVSGTIDYGGGVDLSIDNGDITIDGTDAPNGGICIKGTSFTVAASNVIVKNIRFRYGDTTTTRDVAGIKSFSGNISNVVFDHCSFSWGTDENFNIWSPVNDVNITDVTIQNCIFSEGLNSPAFSKAILIGGQSGTTGNIERITFYNNLFAHHKERHIRANEFVKSFEFVNNVIYNFSHAMTVTHGASFDMINNHYKVGVETVDVSNLTADVSVAGYTIADTDVYISGNTNDGGLNELDSDYSAINASSSVIGSLLTPSNIKSVANTITYVLANAGAIYPKRDAVDIRIINDYLNGTGAVINDETEVGGYPDLTN